MNNTKSASKIIVLIIASSLIAVILFIANSFTGNPISSAFANRAIKDYAAQNYSSLDLEVEKAHYNFKYGGYMARAKSKSSIDNHFAIYYRNGKVQRDDYESYVLGKYNTLSRLEDEYSELVIPMLSKVVGLENNRAMVQVEKREYLKANENIKLDMNFNKTLPIDFNLTIRADLSDNSLKSIATILENAHKVLVYNGCTFTAYDISSEYDGVLVMISNVTPSDIESGELEKLLQDAQNYEDDELDKTIEKGDEKPEPAKRIRVFIKDGKEKSGN